MADAIKRWVALRLDGIEATTAGRLVHRCDGKGRPLVMLFSEGKMSNFKGAALMIDELPRAKVLLGDKGYDTD